LNKVIIAIDGQASTGKSTQAKKIADNLSINYRDSGAYYRAITLYLLNTNINYDFKISQEILDQISISQEYKKGNFRIFLNDDDVTNKVRGHMVSLSVSNYAKKPEIRKFVFDQLRKSAESKSLVVDGRDIGTVVFPEANFKFFLTGKPRIRAERRHKQIDDDSVKVDIIEQEINIRDKTDSTREIAPLRKADDAFKIDVSDLTIDEVFNKILQKIKSD
jgi:cytidylate kinase|tara:strand:- start:15 stop:671 length:657 start_codon:yes stop_codon:yes gene_type:complete